MSKEKKQKEIYTSVFKTKLWKKLSLCCMGAATGSVLLLALLFFGSRSIIYRHMENRNVQQTQKDQVMAELHAFVSHRDFPQNNKKEILQWEKKRGSDNFLFGHKRIRSVSLKHCRQNITIPSFRFTKDRRRYSRTRCVSRMRLSCANRFSTE